mmetsp:Transcript_21327/g.68790  ORF Transcript_21327/g.68790 Transcript_21327/m.68790 type:complete len:311 (-) Transcript_21327:75-1007(-)
MPPPRRTVTSAPSAPELGASCLTGAIVIAVTNPLDSVKQRWQIRQCNSAALGSFTLDIVRSEGVWSGLWKPGLATNMLACSISVGTRLGLYPSLRDALSPDGSSGGSRFASGLLGGALGYIASAPLFAASRVAQAEAGLLAADGASYLTGARRGLPPTVDSLSGLPTLRQMAAERGVLSLWRGADVLVARGALLSATQLATYDAAKRRLCAAGLADGPAVHSAASLAASLALTTAICPFDVTYTAFTAGPTIGRPHASPAAAARALLREGGPVVFLRGWLPLWARFLPSSVLTFHIYEQTRRALLGSYLQ